jgi:hypothetical protein
MELKDAVSILKSRKVITRAHIGSYVKGVRVTSVNAVNIVNGSTTTVAIANFGAHTEYGVAQAKQDLGNGSIDASLNHNLSLGLRASDVKLQKGMVVDLMIEEVTNKDGVKILVVNSVRVPEAVGASNGADMFSEFEAEAVAEEPFTVENGTV